MHGSKNSDADRNAGAESVPCPGCCTQGQGDKQAEKAYDGASSNKTTFLRNAGEEKIVVCCRCGQPVKADKRSVLKPLP